jgi:hypothetical protein
MNSKVLDERIRDRLSIDWLTPSQKDVWDLLHRFDGPPHRVVNVYGPPGSGKSFLGWLMQREGYATYATWSKRPTPVLPRLTLDNAATDRAATRAVRPLLEQLGVRQIVLLSRLRVDEPDMPAFELRITPDDLDCLRGNLYRFLAIEGPEVRDLRNYHEAIDALITRHP